MNSHHAFVTALVPGTRGGIVYPSGNSHTSSICSSSSSPSSLSTSTSSSIGVMLTSHRRSLFLGAKNANGIGFISHKRLTMIATNPAYSQSAAETDVTTSADSSTTARDELSSSSSTPSFQSPQKHDESGDDNSKKFKSNNGIAQPTDEEDSEANVEAAISEMHPPISSDAPAVKAEEKKENVTAKSELRRPPTRPRSYKQYKESIESEPSTAPKSPAQQAGVKKPMPYQKRALERTQQQLLARKNDPRNNDSTRRISRPYGNNEDSNMERRPPMGPVFEPEAGVTYYTRCGKCDAAYEMDLSLLGRGSKVSCSVCSNIWFQRPDRLSKLDPEKEKMTDYPMEKKDELIRKRSNNRGERGGGGGWRNNNDVHNVFIANLSYDVTEEELKRAISEHIETGFRVTIVKDQATGKSKGFAFCDVREESEVNLLIDNMQGTMLKGREMTVRVGKKNNNNNNNNRQQRQPQPYS